MSDKRKKGRVKIGNLKARSLTTSEKAMVKGGVGTPPPSKATAPRADRWTTDNRSDVD